MKESTHVFKKFSQIFSQLTGIQDIDTLSVVIDSIIDNNLNTDFTALYLLDTNEGRLRLFSAKNLSFEERRSAEKTAMERHPGNVFRSMLPLDVPDVSVMPEASQTDEGRLVGVGSRLYMPIMGKDSCLGVLGLASTQTYFFNDEHRAILHFLTHTIGLVYQNILSNRVEKQLKALLDQSQQLANIGGWEYYPSSDDLIFTDKVYEILELPKNGSKISFTTLMELFAGDDRKERLDLLRKKLMDAEGSVSEEREYVISNSRKKWIKLVAISDKKAGKVYRVHGFIQDISEIKKAQIEIEKRENRFRYLFDSIGDAVLIMDKHGNVLEHNQSFEKITGYEHEDIFGMHVRFMVHPDDHEKAEEYNQQLLKYGGFRNLLLRVYRKDRKLIYMEINSNAIYHNGEIIGSQDILRDVTERYINEQKLRELSMVAENTANMIIIAGADRKIEWVNKSFTNVTGYTLEEVKGLSPGKLLQGPNSDKKTIEEIRKCLAEGRSFRGSLLNYAKDGSSYWNDIVINPVKDENGEIVKYIAIENDISYQKKQEEDLIKAKQQAEQASEYKNYFLATTSHEIRTPLNAIIGLSNLMIMENPPESMRENLEILRFSANSLLALINDVLDWSKIEAGKLDFSHNLFDFNSLMRGIYQTFQIKANEKDIQMECEKDPRLPEFVIGDALRLTQILNNIVNNAIKFTEKGKVKLWVTVKEQKDTQCVIHFEVEDTGIGIEPDKLQSVFGSFIQANADISRKYGGTGLGLSITQKLIELQGGTIDVISKYGKGTKFIFELPFEIGNQNPALTQTATEDNQNLKGVRVLLVEDNLINQRVALSYLNHWQAIHDNAINGVVALNKYMVSDFDILLVDLFMPEMDGFELIHKIRHQDKNNQIPIIALTASAENNLIHKAKQAGANLVLSKPFDPKELLVEMRKLLTRKSEAMTTVTEEIPENTSEKIVQIATPAIEEKSLKRVLSTKKIEEASLGSKAFIKEMIVLLAEEIPISLNACHRAILAQDWDLFAFHIHKLKNSLLMFGFDDLLPILKQLEQNARDKKSLTKIPTQYAQIEKAWQDVQNELQDLLK